MKAKKFSAAALALALILSVARGAPAFAAAAVKCDTTQPFSLRPGASYTFKVTVSGSNAAPSFTVGNGGVLKTYFAGRNGNAYYFKVVAAGAPGSAAGVYTALPGQKPARQCVVGIAGPEGGLLPVSIADTSSYSPDLKPIDLANSKIFQKQYPNEEIQAMVTDDLDSDGQEESILFSYNGGNDPEHLWSAWLVNQNKVQLLKDVDVQYGPFYFRILTYPGFKQVLCSTGGAADADIQAITIFQLQNGSLKKIFEYMGSAPAVKNNFLVIPETIVFGNGMNPTTYLEKYYYWSVKDNAYILFSNGSTITG